MRLFELGLQIIFHQLPHARRRHSRRQVRAHRGEDVAAVKRLAHRMTEVLLVGHVAHLALLVQVHHGEHPVIRAQEILAPGFHQNRAARRAHPRVHHHHMHRLLREIAPRLRDQVGAFGDLERRHAVADIHNLRRRADAQDHAFHGAGKVVVEAKIGG